MQDWRESPVNIDHVAEFLQLNPIAATFQWMELVDRALANRAEGNEESINVVKADLHTKTRKREFEQWAQDRPGKPLSEFTERYARSAADRVMARFELEPDALLPLRVEFGLSARAARELQAREVALARGAASGG